MLKFRVLEGGTCEVRGDVLPEAPALARDSSQIGPVFCER